MKNELVTDEGKAVLEVVGQVCKILSLTDRKFDSTGRKRRGNIKGLQTETCNPLIFYWCKGDFF